MGRSFGTPPLNPLIRGIKNMVVTFDLMDLS